MSTINQTLARRANAKRSQGPKTEEGKAASSRSRLQFGFFSRDPLIPGEDAAEWNEFRAALLESLAPAGRAQEMLAERIIDSAWRLRRFALRLRPPYQILARVCRHAQRPAHAHRGAVVGYLMRPTTGWAEHCTGCGQSTGRCPTGGHCTGRYEPPRFCPACGRRLAVRITPTSWTARCRDHGELAGP